MYFYISIVFVSNLLLFLFSVFFPWSFLCKLQKTDFWFLFPEYYFFNFFLLYLLFYF